MTKSLLLALPFLIAADPQASRVTVNGPPRALADVAVDLARQANVRIDVDREEATMTVREDPKTPSARRTVPIHPDLRPMMQERVRGQPAEAFVIAELGPAPTDSSLLPTTSRREQYKSLEGCDCMARSCWRPLRIPAGW